MPILPVDGQYTQFLIVLSSISLDGTEIGSSTSLPTAVVLDSGTTLMYLPKDIAQQIHSQVGAVAAPSSIIAYVPCALRHENRTLDFAFNGIEISVPFNEIVLDSQTASGGRQFDDGTPACLFGIAPNNGGPAVLGDTFLRSAYVVYDLANNEIALAQTNFNSTTDNIKEILAGPRGVPDAKLVSNPKTKVHGLENGAARLADMVISG